MNSPMLSNSGMRSGLLGVNLSWTLSSYSRVMSSLTVNRKMSAEFETGIGGRCSKSELSVHDWGGGGGGGENGENICKMKTLQTLL